MLHWPPAHLETSLGSEWVGAESQDLPFVT